MVQIQHRMAVLYPLLLLPKRRGHLLRNAKGAVAQKTIFFRSFPKKFEFVSLCSFICLQAVYQLSGPVCKATWSGCPSYSASHLHFTLCD